MLNKFVERKRHNKIKGKHHAEVLSYNGLMQSRPEIACLSRQEVPAER